MCLKMRRPKPAFRQSNRFFVFFAFWPVIAGFFYRTNRAWLDTLSGSSLRHQSFPSLVASSSFQSLINKILSVRTQVPPPSGVISEPFSLSLFHSSSVP